MTTILEAVVDKLDAKSYRDGEYYMALCPFHDDHRPSLRISSGGYRCYTCGARGPLSKLAPVVKSAITFPNEEQNGNRGPFPKYENLDALIIRLTVANRWLLKSDAAKYYLQKRQLDDMIEVCTLGYWRGWYTIPVFNNENQAVGAVARASSSIDANRRNPYMVPEGQPNMLYVPNWALFNKSQFVCVVFGVLDAITLVKLGIPACSPTLGQLSCNPKWFSEVRKPIYIIPDKLESPAASTLGNQLGWRGKVMRLSYEYGKDANEYLVAGKGRELYSEILSRVIV